MEEEDLMPLEASPYMIWLDSGPGPHAGAPYIVQWRFFVDQKTATVVVFSVLFPLAEFQFSIKPKKPFNSGASSAEIERGK